MLTHRTSPRSLRSPPPSGRGPAPHPDRAAAGGGRLPRHLVLQPAVEGRVQLQVQRRLRHLPAAAHPHRHLLRRRPTRPSSATAARPQDKNELLHMVSYYDHATGTVPRPTHPARTRRPTTPTTTRRCSSTTRATSGSSPTPTAPAGRRTSTAARSRTPSTSSSWSQKTNFSYTPAVAPARQGVPLPAHALLAGPRPVLDDQRRRPSTWDEPQPLAEDRAGPLPDQLARTATRVGTAFDYHPQAGGLNARTNLYYLETRRPGPDLDDRRRQGGRDAADRGRRTRPWSTTTRRRSCWST